MMAGMQHLICWEFCTKSKKAPLHTKARLLQNPATPCHLRARLACALQDLDPGGVFHALFSCADASSSASVGARIGRFEEMATRYRELLSYMDQAVHCQLA